MKKETTIYNMSEITKMILEKNIDGDFTATIEVKEGDTKTIIEAKRVNFSNSSEIKINTIVESGFTSAKYPTPHETAKIYFNLIADLFSSSYYANDTFNTDVSKVVEKTKISGNEIASALKGIKFSQNI
jgi:hypothetical protein